MNEPRLVDWAGRLAENPCPLQEVGDLEVRLPIFLPNGEQTQTTVAVPLRLLIPHIDCETVLECKSPRQSGKITPTEGETHESDHDGHAPG